MGGANVVRSQHAPFRIVPRLGQVPENGSPVFVSKQTWDVLQERESRSNCAKDSERGGPHVAGVVGSELLAGNGEGLAGESSRDNINHAAIASGVASSDEVSNVPEDGGGIQKTVGDSGFEDLLAVGVDFDISERSPSEKVFGREQAAAGA